MVNCSICAYAGSGTGCFSIVRHLVVLANPQLLGAANFNPKLLLSSF
jgi:hypothetical protein